MNMLLLDKSEVARDLSVEVRGRRAKHLLSVLRAEPGRILRAGLLNGRSGEAEVTAVLPDSVRLRCLFDPEGAPMGSGISLLLALPRPKVLKRLWAPLASLGVDRILLTNAEKVERAYFDTHWLLPEHYVPLLKEGLEQACRTRAPEVSVHMRLKPLVEDDLGRICGEASRLLADPSGPQLSARTARGSNGEVIAAVGPEGGWTDYERALFEANGFKAAGLGPHPLRSDIACVALVSVLSHMSVRAVQTRRTQRRCIRR